MRRLTLMRSILWMICKVYFKSFLVAIQSVECSKLIYLIQNVGFPRRFETVQYDEQRHSVYRVEKEITVPRSDKSKQLVNVLSTFDAPVQRSDIFRYSPKIHLCEFRENMLLCREV